MRILIVLIFINSYLFADDRPLFIGVENTNNCPYVCIKQDSPPTGKFIELFSKFLSTQKQKFEFIPFPVKRLYKNFFNQSVDFKFPDNPDWNVQEKKNYDISYAGPVFTITETLLSSKNKFEQKVINVGILRGYTFNNMAKELKDKEIVLHEYNDESALLESLRKKRVDIIQSNSLIKNNEFLTFKSQTVHYYVSTIKHKKLLERFKLYNPSSTRD